MNQVIPIVLDTDIGDDIDDAYALVLAARWPRVQLGAVTTAYGPTLSRARLARKLLDICGRPDVPVYSADDCEGETPQLAWAADCSYSRPAEGAAEALVRMANERPGQLTLVPIGPLTNLGRALDLDPDFGRKLRRIVLMGGWVYRSYSPETTDPEWNIRCDVPAAKKVFSCGADLVMVGLDACMETRFTDDWQEKLRASGRPWADALLELTRRWPGQVPILYDAITLATVAERFCELQQMRIEVQDDGHTRKVEGEPNCVAAVGADAQAFLDWYVKTVSE
ncbi:MAG: nucleoside hydrolase [Armatimonadetes bacterium]|nr:nucleoside hydrolase [Armatimonadota bacterium]